MPVPPGELLIREKLTSGELQQKSFTYGHVTELILELEFQHIVCAKKIKKRQFSAKFSVFLVFLGSKMLRKQISLNTMQKKTKILLNSSVIIIAAYILILK